MEEMDFDEIVKVAKTLSPVEGKKMIWEKVFSLPEWHFIPYGENNLPFIADVDDKSWIYIFTDKKHVKEFVNELGIKDELDNNSTLTIKTDEVIDFLEKFIELNVYGIRFNDNKSTHGWKIALEKIRPLRDFILEE